MLWHELCSLPGNWSSLSFCRSFFPVSSPADLVLIWVPVQLITCQERFPWCFPVQTPLPVWSQRSFAVGKFNLFQLMTMKKWAAMAFWQNRKSRLPCIQQQFHFNFPFYLNKSPHWMEWPWKLMRHGASLWAKVPRVYTDDSCRRCVTCMTVLPVKIFLERE